MLLQTKQILETSRSLPAHATSLLRICLTSLLSQRTIERGKAIAVELNLTHLEVSAKTGIIHGWWGALIALTWHRTRYYGAVWQSCQGTYLRNGQPSASPKHSCWSPGKEEKRLQYLVKYNNWSSMPWSLSAFGRNFLGPRFTLFFLFIILWGSFSLWYGFAFGRAALLFLFTIAIWRYLFVVIVTLIFVTLGDFSLFQVSKEDRFGTILLEKLHELLAVAKGIAKKPRTAAVSPVFFLNAADSTSSVGVLQQSVRCNRSQGETRTSDSGELCDRHEGGLSQWFPWWKNLLKVSSSERNPSDPN